MAVLVKKSTIDVDYIQHVGDDAMIAASAWVSTSGTEAHNIAQAEPEKIPGLIRYLVKHRHGSPFEHGSVTVRVHAPIKVWREWHRHRIGFSYNEESGRYKQLDPVFYLPPENRPMFKVDDWKPGRPKFLTIEEEAERRYIASDVPNKKYENYLTDVRRNYDRLCAGLMDSYAEAYSVYEDNLSMGFDPGLARDCLPVGIFSACYVTCNPRSIMAFLSLRVHEEDATFVSYPLWEIDNAARQLEEIFKELWPECHAAFVANGRVAP